MSRILLIDDDEDMLAITERWLKKAGYETDTASSGKAALEYLDENTPDLILLDYAMPEMDGPAVLKAVRSDPGLDGIKILYRSGMDDGDIDRDGGGADGVVPKSEGKPGLIKAVEEALS